MCDVVWSAVVGVMFVFVVMCVPVSFVIDCDVVGFVFVVIVLSVCVCVCLL